MDRIRLSHSIPARLKAFGISPAAVVRHAGLPATLLHQERMVVTTAQWFGLWEALEAFTPDPAFGLTLAASVQGEPHDPLAITALSAPSFQAALGKLARYKRLFSAEDLRLVDHGDVWSAEAVWLAAKKLPPPLLIDATLAHIIQVGQRGIGRAIVPERVVLQRDEAHRRMYEAYFRCPIEFCAERNLLLLSRETLMQRFSTANPDLLTLLEPQLEAALHERAGHLSLLDEVKLLLRQRMAGQQLTVDDVAGELYVSPRTLQRRLAAMGVPFQELLEQVRREMAKEYLRAPALALQEVAFLLGYQETSSFHRAFHQWEGVSPGQWRAAQQ